MEGRRLQRRTEAGSADGAGFSINRGSRANPDAESSANSRRGRQIPRRLFPRTIQRARCERSLVSSERVAHLRSLAAARQNQSAHDVHQFRGRLYQSAGARYRRTRNQESSKRTIRPDSRQRKYARPRHTYVGGALEAIPCGIVREIRPLIVVSNKYRQRAASWLARISCQRRGRLLACRTFFRRRIDFGVISTNSSSAINSIACSRLSSRWGISRIASSALEERMFVCFFSFVTFTSISCSREFSPITMPS